MAQTIPHFVLMNPPAGVGNPNLNDEHLKAPSMCESWTRAIKDILPEDAKSSFTVVEGTLTGLPADQLTCDCVVSPANSFGIMDGGYDMALSKAFQSNGQFWSLTRQCQLALHQRWRGYAPPTSCTITTLPDGNDNPWGATTIAIVPTMREPEDVSWHRDLVYNAMWSLLVEIAHWNERAAGPPIQRVLMTGLATGYGNISTRKCATQMMLAVKHFLQGVPEEADWSKVFPRIDEVATTMTDK